MEELNIGETENVEGIGCGQGELQRLWYIWIGRGFGIYQRY